MDKITHCINHNRFIPIDHEELTALELMGKLVEKTNEVVDKTNEVDRLSQENKNKKVSYDDLHNKYKLNLVNGESNFNGTWQGLKKPTLSEEGAHAQVEKNMADIISLRSSITPEYCYDDVQLAVDLAKELGINKVTLLGKSYNLKDTLYLPSNFTIEGVVGETKLILKGIDKPVIDKKGSITGYTTIKNLQIIGDKTMPGNTGIVLNDYYSLIENVSVINVGGYGIHLNGKNASGTLVENVIKNVIVRNSVNTSFYADGGNKITDGYLLGFISRGNGSNRAIDIQSGAGWTIENVHTYGHDQSTGVIQILNSFNTNVNNIYIENFKSTAINLLQCQQNLNINNVVLMTSADSVNCFYFNRSTALSYGANVVLNNISVTHNIGNDLNICNGDGSAVTIKINNVSTNGTQTSRIKLYSSNVANYIKTADKVNIKNELTDNEITLYHKGSKLKKYVTTKFSGNNEKTINVTLPQLIDYDKIWIDVKIFSEKWDNGGNRCYYNASVYISLKTGNELKVGVFKHGEVVGFTTEPTYFVDKNNKTLTITFTQTESDGQGCAFIEYMI